MKRLLLALLCLPLCSPALTVRVDPAGGAPRWTVDGQPVRARVFWGAPGHARLSVSEAWTPLVFEFVAETDATNGTLHFRCGPTPGEVTIDNVRIVELDSGREVVPLRDFDGGPATFAADWTFWPVGAANTVGEAGVTAEGGHHGTGGMRITLRAPPKGQEWPDYHVYHVPRLSFTTGRRYRVTLDARAQPPRKMEIGIFRPGARFVRIGAPPGVFEHQVRLAASAGVHFVSFPVDLPWPKPGATADWHNVDTACRAVLNANPAALLLPRIPMNPPDWWRTAHPDEVMQWEDGRRDAAVPASPVYRRDAAERLSVLIEHLEATIGDHVAGYHPVGQNTGEWFYEDTWKRPLNGYAPADLTAWRTWLARHYPDDAALRGAWSDTNITRATAVVPDPARRHAAPAGVLRDPATEQPLIDWSAFQQEAMADCVTTLARAARTASRGRKLVLFFYGYGFEFGAVPTGPAVSGHYALRRALDCPDIDVLCSPISYFDRGLGGSAPAMSAAESVALAGKMWLNEDDTHTYLAAEKPPGWDAHVDTIEETNAELVRNTAQAALRNFATWWMDLCASGWFDDPRMWAEMRRLEPLDRELLAHPTPYRPEVAVVLDERAMRFASADAVRMTRTGIYEARAVFGRLGAPYGQYLMDDVLAGRVPAKMYIFLNAWSLSAAERESLLRATRGATRIWCHAPVYFEDGRRASAEAQRVLTGFELRERPRGPVHPLFSPADAATNEVLAHYPDGAPAAAMRAHAEGRSVFLGPPGFSSELLRRLAREAGVHLFTSVDCNVQANGPFLSLHAAATGPHPINTGQSAPIGNAFTGEALGRGPILTLPLQRGETIVLRIK